jgi:RNA polymerase sigma-70 factor (ECF subfamily)
MSASAIPLQADCTHYALAQARSGNKDAFADLVSPHASSLQRLALRITRNWEDAEDVCQDSLLKAFTKLDQFAGSREVTGREFRSWLMKIASNSAIDCIRRKRADNHVPLEEFDQVGSASSQEARIGQEARAGWGENPETAYARREQRCEFLDAIAKLPAGLRTVCLLRNVMEFSTNEVALKLGISTLAVRLRLFRAQSHVRKNLRDVAGEGSKVRAAIRRRRD